MAVVGQAVVPGACLSRAGWNGLGFPPPRVLHSLWAEMPGDTGAPQPSLTVQPALDRMASYSAHTGVSRPLSLSLGTSSMTAAWEGGGRGQV